MSWFRVDDDFHSHRKVQALKKGPCRDAALALWLRSGSYSSQANLGGFVPEGTADDFAGHEMAASELVRVNLWELYEGGYQFHDWEDYNPSGRRVEEKKRLARERKAKSRAKLSKPMSSDVVESRVTVGDCIPVTRESRVSHAAVTPLVTHESLGDRDRDLKSSSEFSEESRVDANSRRRPDDAHYLLGVGKQPRAERLTPEQRHTLQIAADEMGLGVEHLQGAKAAQVDLVASAARRESANIQGLSVDDGLRRIVKKWTADEWVKANSAGFGHLASTVDRYMTKVAAPSVSTFQQHRELQFEREREDRARAAKEGLERWATKPVVVEAAQ